MGRSMMVLLVVGLLGAMLAGSASARTPRVRWDPMDDGHHDIRKVVTDRTSTHVVLRIGLWGSTRPWGGGQILALMDTRGTRATDRYVTFQRRRCRVQEGRTSHYRYIGRRHVRRRGERTIGCNLPLGWFDITNRVRFRVVHPGLTDEAPNGDGWYTGL